MVQVSVADNGRYPSQTWWKEWKPLGFWGQAPGLEAPPMSAPVARRDIIQPILPCATHVTRLN